MIKLLFRKKQGFFTEPIIKIKNILNKLFFLLTDSRKMLYNINLKKIQRATVDNLLTTFEDSPVKIRKMFSRIFLEEYEGNKYNPLLKNKIRNSRNSDTPSKKNITPYK